MALGASPATALARVRPHLVAAFVVVHVLACVLDALPNVKVAMDRRNWREPRVQVEIAAWSKRLGVEPRVLEDNMWALTNAWLEVRSLILAPVRPYLDVTGVRQNWGMFAAGSRYRDRFQIRGRACVGNEARCVWRALYTSGVDGEDFLREHLEHPRIRSGSFRWVWADHTVRYRRSCTLLARRVFEAFPDVEMVQCRFERSLAPSPERGAPPPAPPTWHSEFSVTRATAYAEKKP